MNTSSSSVANQRFCAALTIPSEKWTDITFQINKLKEIVLAKLLYHLRAHEYCCDFHDNETKQDFFSITKFQTTIRGVE